MPTYEMPLLLRLGKKTEYKNILKSVANAIFETGGFIRIIENWGDKKLACKANAHNENHTHAGHFMLCFDAAPSEIIKIQDYCQRNINVVRAEIYKQNVPEENVQCTFEEEQLPPPYRPSVQKLLEKGNRQRLRKKFQHNSGLDHYPFTK